MKTFLVPVDFSEASENAAEYAAHMAALTENSKLILYNVYEKVSLKSLSEYSRKTIADGLLKKLYDKLLHRGISEYECVSEEGTFIPNLKKYVVENDVDIVIMGITGSSRIKQVFMGSNALNAVRNVHCPIMIVPPKAKFTGIKNLLLTSDFKDVTLTTPFKEIKQLLDLFDAKLHIVNVDKEHYIELTTEYKKERNILEKKFSNYNPEFYFLRTYDFLDGIGTFVKTNKIDAIITIPKHHNFLKQMFQVTHTKALAYHSHIPLVAVHQ
ncbi:hypothetical protein BH09BAC2_BH09BAC2_24120 [soil metagenome]